MPFPTCMSVEEEQAMIDLLVAILQASQGE
jgi:hypothetical protein